MNLKFHLLTGEQAYFVLYVYNDFRISLETLMAIDQNLEIIIDDQGLVYAYRYDHPLNMRDMVLNDGVWIFTYEFRNLSIHHKYMLITICRNYSMN